MEGQFSSRFAFPTMKTKERYAWAAWGDINAFFGLMLDNVAVMVLLVTTISSPQPPEQQSPGSYRFTPEFVLTKMIPGTALGVFLGDMVYSWMAFRLARRSGRSDITAMPLGLDTPSTFGVALLILLPALNYARTNLKISHEDAMVFAWQVGAVVLILIGVFKALCAPLGNAVRRWVPRAGLLGSLAAIALALIAFIPLLMHIAAVPLVGFLSLTLILVTLVAHRALPGRVPGALAAVVVGVLLYHGLNWLGGTQGWNIVPPHSDPQQISWSPPDLLPAFDWAGVMPYALGKLPIALPFALATIVGGIDCTESAASAGDEYDTRTILLTEGLTSVAAGFLGGVIQTTPYIGHPAFKAMGGRSGYTIATALFVGAIGYFGWFTHFFNWMPEAAMFPILVFVGLEITAQSFRATPPRHYPALALAALPALAYLATIPLGQTLEVKVDGHGAQVLQTLRCLANGFIVTSLLWGACLAAILDGSYPRAAVYLLVAGVCALFGIIHSPLLNGPIDLPGNVVAALDQLPTAEARKAAAFQTPYHWATSYIMAAGLLGVLAWFPEKKPAGGKEDFKESSANTTKAAD
jgi:AGZA family xanthine/uracil permease-like MFS transporter